MTIPQISNPPSTNWAVQVNEIFLAAGQALLFARKHTLDSGFDLGFVGVDIDGTTVADDTVTCANGTRYIIAHRTTYVLTAESSSTNYDAGTTYGKVGIAIFASGALTSFTDARFEPGGIFDHAAGVGFGDALTANPLSQFAATTSAQLRGVISDETGTDALVFANSPVFTGNPTAPTPSTGDNDTSIATTAFVQNTVAAIGLSGFRYVFDDGTGATDPGAGVIRFNNATLASVTAVYIDDSTTDGVDLSTLLGSLGSSGLIKVTSVADVGEWRVYKWTAAPTDNTGWWTFTVVDQAGTGTFEDGDEVQVIPLQLAASGLALTDGDKGDITVASSGAAWTIDNDVVSNAKLANVATKTTKGRTSASTGDPEDLTIAQNRQMHGVRVATLTDGANIAVDAESGGVDTFRVTLGGNRTLDNPTNMIDGQPLNFYIKQDGTGSRTLAYGSKYDFPAGTAPVLSTAASSRDLLCCIYDSTEDRLLCVMSKAFS